MHRKEDLMTTSLEITGISAQGIINTNKSKTTFSLFSPRLRPFITLTTYPPPPINNIGCHVYTTRVDDEGGPNPSWDEKFLLPLDPTFFTNAATSSCVNLQLHNKRAFFGRVLLGWAQIPASDILDGPIPNAQARHLSYRIQARDGSRGHGVVNVALRLVGQVPAVGVTDTWRLAIGVPVATYLVTCPKKDMENMTRNVCTSSSCSCSSNPDKSTGKNDATKNKRQEREKGCPLFD